MRRLFRPKTVAMNVGAHLTATRLACWSESAKPASLMPAQVAGVLRTPGLFARMLSRQASPRRESACDLLAGHVYRAWALRAAVGGRRPIRCPKCRAVGDHRQRQPTAGSYQMPYGAGCPALMVSAVRSWCWLGPDRDFRPGHIIGGYWGA